MGNKPSPGNVIVYLTPEGNINLMEYVVSVNSESYYAISIFNITSEPTLNRVLRRYPFSVNLRYHTHVYDSIMDMLIYSPAHVVIRMSEALRELMEIIGDRHDSE